MGMSFRKWYSCRLLATSIMAHTINEVTLKMIFNILQLFQHWTVMWTTCLIQTQPTSTRQWRTATVSEYLHSPQPPSTTHHQRECLNYRMHDYRCVLQIHTNIHRYRFRGMSISLVHALQDWDSNLHLTQCITSVKDRCHIHYSWYQWKWYNLRLTTSQPQTTASLLTHSSRVGQTQRNIDQMRVASVSYQEISTLLVNSDHWRHKQSHFGLLTEHTYVM